MNILDFAQAQEKARDWFARLASGEAAGAADGGLRKIGSQAGQEIWRGKSFIANKKGVLLRVLREKGIEPTPEAQKALDALPDTFREFCVAITERPKVAPGELFQGAPSVRGGTVQRDEAA